MKAGSTSVFPAPLAPSGRGARGEKTHHFATVAWSMMALCGCLTGCATTSLLATANPTKQFVKATPQNPAVKCLCVWQSAEGYDAQGKPCRGIAGQVFFFSRNSLQFAGTSQPSLGKLQRSKQAMPVIVEGDVRIFLFDDQGSEEEQSKPISQIDIDRQTWNSQLTNTQFGPAYQFFVPYVRPGRHQAQLAVRLRMTPDNGPVVFSDLASVDMAGYKAEKSDTSEESRTSARVEQTLRQHLAGDDRAGSSSDRQLADAHSQATERSASRTIATIRTTAQSQN